MKRIQNQLVTRLSPSCAQAVAKCVVACPTWLLGGHSFLLWHAHMADGRGFPGGRSHHRSRHSEDVRGGGRGGMDEAQEEGPEEPPLRAKGCLGARDGNDHWKERRAGRRYRGTTTCVCVRADACARVCHLPSSLRIERWTPHRSGECIVSMPLSEVGSACRHAWSRGKWPLGQNKVLS